MNKILINKENGKPLAAVLRKEEGIQEYSRAAVLPVQPLPA